MPILVTAPKELPATLCNPYFWLLALLDIVCLINESYFLSALVIIQQLATQTQTRSIIRAPFFCVFYSLGILNWWLKNKARFQYKHALLYGPWGVTEEVSMRNRGNLMDGFVGATLLVVLLPAWPWPDSKRMRPLCAVNITKAAGWKHGHRDYSPLAH